MYVSTLDGLFLFLFIEKGVSFPFLFLFLLRRRLCFRKRFVYCHFFDFFN